MYEVTNKETLLSTIPLSDFTELRITEIKKENDSLDSIDIRQWYCTSKDTIKKPTQKGVRLKPEHIGVVAEILNNYLG